MAMVGMHVVSGSDPIVEVDVVIQNLGARISGPITLFLGNLPAGVTLMNSNKSPMGNFIILKPTALNSSNTNHLMKVQLFFEVPLGINMNALHKMTMDVFSNLLTPSS
jgi:hypothetical protein